MPEERESTQLSFENSAVVFITDSLTGDTVFKDVTLLAEGTWTDIETRKSIYYPASELVKMIFQKKTIKAQHDIYNKLPLINEIGIVENEKYVTYPSPRWIGDVRIFPTQNGKDVTTLLQRKQITDISSELLHILTRNETGGYTSSNILFMGAAPVRTGACKPCTFNEGDFLPEGKTSTQTGGDSSMVKPNEEKKTGTENGAGTDRASEVAMLEAKLADATKIKEQGLKIQDLERQITELESEPIVQTRIAKSGAAFSASELDSGEWQSFMAKDFPERD